MEPLRRSSPIMKMVVGVSVFVAVCLVAAIGYMLAGWHASDAFYMVVITIFGVGYGEVRPIDTWSLRTLTAMVIVLGYGAVIYTVGGFIQLVVDGELNRALGARRMNNDIERLNGHTIICGYGRMGTSLARDLSDAGHPFVAIDTLGGASNLVSEDGYLVIEGDATEEEVLLRAGIERASVLATVLSDDAANVFVTLTARELNADLTIIARGEHRQTERKLRTCGADTVVMTTTIGAARISQLIMRPTADELLDRLTSEHDVGIDLEQIGLEFDELPIGPTSTLANKTLAEIEVRGAHGYLVVGIRHATGETIMHPSSDTVIEVGDVVVVLGYEDDIPELATRFAPDAASAAIRYRGARL